MGFRTVIRYTLILSCVFYGTITVIFLQRTNESDTEFLGLDDIKIISKFDADIISPYNQEAGMTSNTDRILEQTKTRKAYLNNKNTEREKRKPITTKNVSHFVNRLPKKRQILAEMWDNYNRLRRKTDTMILYNGDHDEARNSFQAVGEDIYVFSAYFDNRQSNNNNSSVVRIIALSRLKSNDNLLCKFSRVRDGQWVVATRQEMSDNHEKLFGGVMYICTIPPIIGNEPPRELYLWNLITLGGNNSNSTSVTEKLVMLQVIPKKPSFLKENIHQVHKLDYTRKYSWQDKSKQTDITSQYKNNQKITPASTNNWKSNYQGRQVVNTSVLNATELPGNGLGGKQKIAVCVPPIFGNVRISEFIQFIEIHKILGVSHFIFYPMNISHDINQMLNYYKSEGLVTTVSWVIPSSVKSSNIWYNAQILAMQDCLYRTMGNFNLTAFLDLDEVIVPRKTTDWHSMFEHLDDSALMSDNEQYASFRFKSGFYGTPPQISAMAADTLPSYTVRNHKLSYLNKIFRNSYLSSVRTKVVVKPDYIEQIGIHHVAKLLSSKFKMVEVPNETAIIHHYRKCTTVSDEQMNCGEMVKDGTMLKYSNLLSKNYHSTLDRNVKFFKTIKPP